MRYVLFVLYFIITWFIVIINNIFIILWFLNFNNIYPYGYWFLSIKTMRKGPPVLWYERFFYDKEIK